MAPGRQLNFQDKGRGLAAGRGSCILFFSTSSSCFIMYCLQFISFPQFFPLPQWAELALILLVLWVLSWILGLLFSRLSWNHLLLFLSFHINILHDVYKRGYKKSGRHIHDKSSTNVHQKWADKKLSPLWTQENFAINEISSDQSVEWFPTAF